ncbi:MAG: response regulator [Thermodesulfobacteriota bacterium]
MEMKENALKGKRILIVDDEPDMLETLEEMLSMCQITKASTFEQAKKQLETQTFDFAILDIMGVNGYKLLDIAVERNMTAVMLTAHALSPQDTVRSFKGGAASFVPKDEMGRLPVFLMDIMEAKEKGKSLWQRWMDRMGEYYDKKFGRDWKKSDKEFWDNFPYYYT